MGLDLLRYENLAFQEGFRTVAGLDEAGRGPLAGPVVSAAVILPDGFSVQGVTDSKKLSENRRERLYPEIYSAAAAIGIGIVDPPEIDRINILNAALMSMAMAIDNLEIRPDFLLVDGNRPLRIGIPQKTIPKGDCLSMSIAAASIVAKVTRDRLMMRYDLDYPEFGFARHKGYPTRAHLDAIDRYGCCPIHRRTFRGVVEVVQPRLF